MTYEKTIAHIDQEITEVFEKLDRYFELPTALRAFKLASDAWSIDEILEHVTLTSHFLLIVIRKGRDKALKRASSQTVSTPSESDLEAISVIGHPDSFRWLRPEHMEPNHTKPSSEIRLTMRQQANECLEILRQLNGGIGTLHKVRMSVRELGKLDMYQWLYFLTQHAKRHSLEIERITGSMDAD